MIDESIELLDRHDKNFVIDYVLVYETSLKCKSCEDLARSLARKKFVSELVKQHKIQYRKEVVLSGDRKIGFYLLNLPYATLINLAERYEFKVPLKKLKPETHENSGFEFIEKVLKIFENQFFCSMPRLCPFSNHSCAIFKTNHSERYAQDISGRVYFTTTQRQFAIKEIVDSIVYYDNNSLKQPVRFISLLKQDAFKSAYALHDNFTEKSGSIEAKESNRRELLYTHWASWRNLFKYQPIDEIQEYFGVKIAFYFSWLGFYTTWIASIALLGFIFFLFGHFDPSNEEGSTLICNEDDEIEMCPLCEECTRWHLADICFTAKLNRAFDNQSTLLFALVLNFWSIVFLQLWKRHSSYLSYKWNLLNFENEENNRLDYCFKATNVKKNLVTDKQEPYFPKRVRLWRQFIGFLVLLAFVLISILMHFTIISLRIQINHYMFLIEGFRSFASLFSNVTSGLLTMIGIILIDHIFEKIARRVNDWEMHRVETKYENSLILKLFTLFCVNYYAQVFYKAFLKGRIKWTFYGFTYFETCSHTGCYIEIAFYLLINFVVKQIIKFLFETAYPELEKFLNIIKTGIPKAINRWEKDYQLFETKDLIPNYLHITIQFGFILLFAAAFPLGAIFAFFYNLLVIRVQARKFLCESRRKVFPKTKGIGIWFNIWTAIANVSIITNACIIAFSSDLPERIMYMLENGDIEGYTNRSLLFYEDSHEGTCRYFSSRNLYLKKENNEYFYKLQAFRLTLVVVFQNILLLLQKLIQLLIPKMSHELKIEIKREKYRAKTVLLDHQFKYLK